MADNVLAALLEGDRVEHDSVRFTADGAAEMDRHRPAVFVPRADIQRIELVYGSGAERPLVALILGVTLIGAAVFAASLILFVIIRQGNLEARVIAPGVAFVIPGLWLVDLAMKKRWFVLVHTPRGTRKLLFKTSRDESALQDFMRTVRSRYGL